MDRERGRTAQVGRVGVSVEGQVVGPTTGWVLGDSRGTTKRVSRLWVYLEIKNGTNE